jgi:DNA-binding MarR family transcriptional regulator
MRRKRIKPGQLVDVRLTPQERDLILERTLIDSEREGRLRGATPRGSNLVVRLTLDDVDDLAGHVAAEANHSPEPRVRRVLDAVSDRLASIEHTFTDEEGPAETVAHASKPFTAKQGQYLAYIYYYTKIHGRPPAESDLQRFFRVTPPVVHQMIKTLDARGLIERQPLRSRTADFDYRCQANHLTSIASTPSIAVNLCRSRGIDRVTSRLRHSRCCVEVTRCRGCSESARQAVGRS